ncbi:MAG TPA: MFS transporter [Acidimicrobiales bacterium]
MRGERLGASLGAARAVFARPQLRRAELAFAAALTGEWAVTVALAVVAFDDGGAAGVGLVALIRMVPSAVGTPVITAYSDRTRRERALATVSILRAVTIGGAAVVLAVDAPHVFMYALVVLATAAFTVFRPTHSSLLPLLCTTTAELTGANVVRGVLESLATLVGPVVAGALLAASGPAAAFGAAAVFSLMAAGLLLRIDYDAPARTEPTERSRLVEGTADGLKAVAGHRDLRLLFGLGFAQTYVRGSLNVFTVVMAFELLDLGDSGVAALTAAVGVGGLIGALGVSLLVGSRHLGVWLMIALVLWGAPLAVIGAVPVTAVAFAVIAVIGVANTIIDVPLFTLPVRLVRDDVLTRVFGVFESIITIGVALGSALTPVVIALLGLEGAMIATGALLPVIALLAWRPLVALDERLGVRDDEIDALRRTPMLQLLPVPSIEYLASRVDTHPVAAGSDLCRQGGRGDSFFVIVAGEADVIGDGETVASIGPGAGVGEIALLRDVPRTATVRARENLVVMEIERQVFLEVVTGHSTTHEAANEVVAQHLADYHPARVGI